MSNASRVSYGWVIVAGACLSFAVSTGLMHAFTVFFVVFIEEFGWSRADASLAYALSQLCIGVSAPLIGIGVDRYGPRRLVILGSSILAISLVAQAYVSSLWQVTVLYGVIMTLGANCLGLVVFMPVLTRWFTQQRGLTIAAVQSASGVGRAVATPLVQALVLALGWRQTSLLLAALLALLMVPLGWFLRIPSPDAHESPLRRAVHTHPTTETPPYEWRLADAMRTPHFWLLFAVYMFTGLGSYFVSLHQLAFASDMGFDKLYAATVLGVGSLLTIGGILAFGVLSDYIGREITGILAYVISILGVACALGITGPADVGLFWCHACFFGMTWGTRGPLITAKSADLFQGRHLGIIFGVISIGTGIGSAVGTWVSGWIFDLFGSYQLAFLLSIASYLGGCVTFWLLRRSPAQPPQSRGNRPPSPHVASPAPLAEPSP